MKTKLIDFLKAKWINILLIMVCIGLPIYFIWDYLRTKANQKFADVAMPDIPDGATDITKEFKAKALLLAIEINETLTGIATWAVTKEKLFVKLDVLSDAQLIYLYRVYNTRYYSKTKETMTEIIVNEWNVSVGGIRDQLVARLRNLKCL